MALRWRQDLAEQDNSVRARALLPSSGLGRFGPQVVDRALGVGATFACERDQRRHGRVDLGERELGRDETRLKTRQGNAVGKPELGVVPAITGSAWRITAAACCDHDQVAAAEQALLGLVIQGEAVGHDVVDPCLDRARSAEVVERQAEQDRVSLLDLGYQLLREPPRFGLRWGVLFRGDLPREAASGVEVWDRIGA